MWLKNSSKTILSNEPFAKLKNQKYPVQHKTSGVDFLNFHRAYAASLDFPHGFHLPVCGLSCILANVVDK